MPMTANDAGTDAPTQKRSVLGTTIARYSRAGLLLPSDIRARVGRLIEPIPLAAIEWTDPDPESLVLAWRATRAARAAGDEIWVVLLDVFRVHFDNFVPGLNDVMQRHHMGIFRTKIEIALQFGGRCFFAGRHIVAAGGELRVGHYLLSEAVAVLTEVARDERTLKPDKRRAYHGQIGTASVILARKSEDAGSHLERAERHLLEAEGLGDHTEEHFAYLAEVYLRRYARSFDQVELGRASRAVEARSTATTRRLLAVIADVAAARALSEPAHWSAGDIVNCLYEAESGYGQALQAVDASGLHDGYLLARRGHVRHRLYRRDTDQAGRRKTTMLEGALSDLLDARTRDHVHPNVVAHALLDRARLRRRRNDEQGSAADIAEARRVLADGEVAASDTKVRALELDLKVFAAVARRDVAEVRALVAAIVDLDGGTPAPAGALALGLKLLAAELPAEQSAPILLPALERLEIDMDHPALTGAARRHVAGHAALVCWLLARRAGDIALLERTVELYRQCFAAVDMAPSVDALANAGTCALALAKLLLAGDEAAGEESARLLHDSTVWIGSALAREAEGPPDTPGFDRRILYSRVGEAAVRVYPLTWDPAYLDLAISHLRRAQSEGDSSPNVEGLLGDAFYRRGLRNGAAEDLAEAIERKQVAFDAWHERRENRSLSAAAALRLFRLTDDEAWLTRAARCALESAVADDRWPWAVLQLADLARFHEAIQTQALAGQEPADLTALLLAGDRRALLQRAASLAVHTEEFRSSVLGGQKRTARHGVFVLNDPHRLLEQAIVLKRLRHEDASRELEWTRDFSEWLAARDAPSSWLLPEPLGIVGLDDSGDGVYVMRRRQGRPLGALIVESHASPGQEDHLDKFEQALAFLAAFQVWRLEADGGPGTHPADRRDELTAQIARTGERLGLHDDTRDHIGRAVAPFASADTFHLPQKDPHPGNWLWSPRDELVLIDVETTGAMPVLYEIVALIDDLPLLPVTIEGWAVRRRLSQHYLDTLTRWGVNADRTATVSLETYDVFVLIRAVAGISRLNRNEPGTSSFATAHWNLQYHHYRELLQWLARDGSGSSTVRFAAMAVCRDLWGT